MSQVSSCLVIYKNSWWLAVGCHSSWLYGTR